MNTGKELLFYTKSDLIDFCLYVLKREGKLGSPEMVVSKFNEVSNSRLFSYNLSTHSLYYAGNYIRSF